MKIVNSRPYQFHSTLITFESRACVSFLARHFIRDERNGENVVNIKFSRNTFPMSDQLC